MQFSNSIELGEHNKIFKKEYSNGIRNIPPLDEGAYMMSVRICSLKSNCLALRFEPVSVNQMPHRKPIHLRFEILGMLTSRCRD